MYSAISPSSNIASTAVSNCPRCSPASPRSPPAPRQGRTTPSKSRTQLGNQARVTTSQFNRAYQTAKLAGFDNVDKSIDITEGGLVVSPKENTRRAQAFRKLASAVPPTGTNILIVNHKPN